MKDLHLQDSSDVILFNKEKEELKVYDLDNAMGNELGVAEETKFNFYASINLDQENQDVSLPKRKKKKKGIKKKNLFKDDKDNKEDKDYKDDPL